MQSIGLAFKQEQLIMVALKQGFSEIYLEGHHVLSLLEAKEEERESLILPHLDQFCKTYRGGRDNVFIALPRDAALVQFLNLPLAVEEICAQRSGMKWTGIRRFPSMRCILTITLCSVTLKTICCRSCWSPSGGTSWTDT